MNRLHFISFLGILLLFFPLAAAIPAGEPTPPEEGTLSEQAQAAALVRAKGARCHWPSFGELKILYMNDLGIRALSGRYVDLYTDLPPNEKTDEMIRLLDAAVPRLCEFFHLDPREYDSWKISAFLMTDREPFEIFGAFDFEEEPIPEFPNGFSLYDRIWVFDKHQTYYNRFLMLHELVHAFMLQTFGSLDPCWFTEGIAEFLALHSWDGEKIELGIFPDSPEQVEGFGRIDRIRSRVQAGDTPSVKELLNLERGAFDNTTTYAWCWALVTLLARNPEYAGPLSALPYLAMEEDPNRQFIKLLGAKAKSLPADWQHFAEWIDYGFDFDHKPEVRPRDSIKGDIPDEGITVTLDAETGSLATGLILQPGKEYRLSASGRFHIGCRGKVYPCEPNGITLSYFNSRPIGTLLAEIVPEGATLDELPIQTEPIGTKGNITPKKQGELYLRLNIPTNEIKNSKGTCSVALHAEESAPTE